MKKIFLTLLTATLFSMVGFAQTPQGFQYQAVLRDPAGLVMANTPALMHISILQGSATSAAVYTETHTDTTNAFGLVNLQIGLGTVSLGIFDTINWAQGPYFVKVSV